MPVVTQEDFGTPRAPGWCRIEGGICGLGAWSCGLDGRVEPHFHDCEEFWFVTRGAARIVTDGQTLVVRKGDVVCTKMGDEHALVETVDAPYEHLWVACNPRGRQRPGHLHRGVDDPS